MKDFHELTRNNTLIAEFMGYEKDFHSQHTDVYNNRVPIYLIDINWFPAKKMKYHTSWDWLMPVVEKIGEIRMPTRYSAESLMTVNINSGHCEITGTGTRIFSSNSHASSCILSAYSVVIQFINWYNSQTTKTK